jgi:hypothetical protein
MKKHPNLEWLIKRALLAAPLGVASVSCGGSLFPVCHTTVADSLHYPDGGTDTLSTASSSSLVDAGALSSADCHLLCSSLAATCESVVDTTDGGQLVVCHDPVPCKGGRRPKGLQAASVAPASGPGAYLAQLAHLETASVVAFERLAGALERLGAPRPLVERARRSARDEVRHAQVVSALARRWGAQPEEPRVEPASPGSLAELAMENAAEGCVGETYGALVAAYQAEQAPDPEVREAMRRIAQDERRHAELAWDLATWAEPHLSAVERGAVAGARRAAAAELRSSAAVSLELQATLGLPGAEAAGAMMEVAWVHLWA